MLLERLKITGKHVATVGTQMLVYLNITVEFREAIKRREKQRLVESSPLWKYIWTRSPGDTPRVAPKLGRLDLQITLKRSSF